MISAVPSLMLIIRLLDRLALLRPDGGFRRSDLSSPRVTRWRNNRGAPASVQAAIRRTYPSLQPQRLKNSSLIALSWAIEEECCARAESPLIFGSFQQERYFRAAEERWTE